MDYRKARDLRVALIIFLGEEHSAALMEGMNYAVTLLELERYAEVKNFLQRRIPVARRVLGDVHMTTVKLVGVYARSLYKDPAATLDDLHEAVTTLEDAERIARRVFGNAHPAMAEIEGTLRKARAALRAREPPSRSA